MKRVLLFLALLFATSAHAKPLPRLWDTSPLAQMMRADMAHAGTDGLQQLVRTLGTRLIVSPEQVAIGQVGDVELLWRLATAVQMLVEVSTTPATRLGEPSQVPVDVLQVERATAFALFAVGHRYQTRDDFRFAIDRLEDDSETHGRHLVAAVRSMRDYGRRWFEDVYARLAALGGEALDSETQHQRGRMLLDLGEVNEAATLLSEIFLAAPKRELSRTMCEAALKAGVGDGVQRFSELAQHLRKNHVLGVATEFEACLEQHALVSATDAFEKLDSPGIEEVAAQIERLSQLERHGAAEALARRAIELSPKRGMEAAGALFFRLRRWPSLDSLFEDARQRGVKSERLDGLEVLAKAAQASQAALNGAGEAEVEEAIRQLEASSLPPIVWRTHRVLLLVAQWLGAPAGTPPLTQLDKALADLLKHHGQDLTALGVYLVAMIGTDRTEAALKLLGPKASAVERAAKGQTPARTAAIEFQALLGRVELGMGVRERDLRRLQRGLDALKKIDERRRARLAPEVASELRLAEAIGRLAYDSLSGELSLAAILATSRERELEPTRAAGRYALQARAMTLGTVAALEEEDASALPRWVEARQGPDSAIGLLAAALSQQVMGDLRGASELCAQASESERPATAQILTACIAHGAEGERARAAWGRVLALWDEVRLPHEGRLPLARPLFYGTFDVGVRVVDGEPFAVALEAHPTIALVPELVPPRQDIEERAR